MTGGGALAKTTQSWHFFWPFLDFYPDVGVHFAKMLVPPYFGLGDFKNQGPREYRVLPNPHSMPCAAFIFCVSSVLRMHAPYVTSSRHALPPTPQLGVILTVKYRFPLVLFSSFTASIFAVLNLVPFEVLKARLFVEPSYAKNLVDGFQRVVREEVSLHSSTHKASMLRSPLKEEDGCMEIRGKRIGKEE